METFLQVLLVLIITGFIFFFWFNRKKPQAVVPLASDNLQKLLTDNVPFYQQLDDEGKEQFEKRAMHFLKEVRITGVNTKADDLDRVLIAASAIIPIFHFPQWEYCNLNEVLLYPDSFDHEFQQKGAGRSILGMVGHGAMNNVMILSQHELRQAFLNKTGKDNTAIHEFVHLLDKTDGDVDGVPESLMDKKYVRPWLQLMQQKIQAILHDKSDINPYWGHQ